MAGTVLVHSLNTNSDSINVLLSSLKPEWCPQNLRMLGHHQYMCLELITPASSFPLTSVQSLLDSSALKHTHPNVIIHPLTLGMGTFSSLSFLVCEMEQMCFLQTFVRMINW